MKKNKISLSFKIIIISIVLLSIFFIAGFKIYFSFSKNIYNLVFNNFEEDITSTLTDVTDIITFNVNTPTVSEGNITFSSNNEILTNFASNEINYKFHNNNVNTINGSISFNSLDKNILDTNILIDEITSYVSSSNIDSTVYKNEPIINYSMLDSNLNIEYIEVLTKLIFNSFSDTIDNENFIKENKEIDLNGKKTQVTAHIYKLDNVDYKKTVDEIFAILSTDENLKKLSDASNSSSDAISANLQNLKNSLVINSEDDFIIEVYTNGFFNKVVGLSVFLNNDFHINYVNNTDIDVFTVVINDEGFIAEVNKDFIRLGIYENNSLNTDYGYIDIVKVSDTVFEVKYILKQGDNLLELSLKLTSITDTEKLNKYSVDINFLLKSDSNDYYVKSSLINETTAGVYNSTLSTSDYKEFDDDTLNSYKNNFIDILTNNYYLDIFKIL